MSWRTFFRDELKQLHEEGYTSEKARERIRKSAISTEGDAVRLMGGLRRVPRRHDYGYKESTEHADLSRIWRGAGRQVHPAEKELADRLQEAFNQRISGGVPPPVAPGQNGAATTPIPPAAAPMQGGML